MSEETTEARPLRRMTAEQADEAAVRYASGEGLLELASDYDVNTATVRHHVIKRGVAMRRRGPSARRA